MLLCWPAFVDGLLAQEVVANDSSMVVVDSIRVTGNRRTRESIVLRELAFAVGDTLERSTLPEVLETNRLRVLNLALFTSAKCYVARELPDGHLVLQLDLKESWYTYPVPLFELADRNFNVWWYEFDHTLRRVNYGINWYQLNLSGRGDRLRLNAKFGDTNRYEAVYTSPAATKSQNIGIQAGIRSSPAHEVAVVTNRNKLDFRRNPGNWQIERLQANIGITWRPGFFSSQSFVLEYHRNEVIDTIADFLNPDFFLNGKTLQRHTSFLYTVKTDHRDIRPYPLKGYYGQMEFRWNGLLPSDDLHLARLRGEWRQYLLLHPKVSLEMIGVARVSLPDKKPPYFNNQALGYGGDYVNGYEYFVADGLHYGLLKTAFHWKVLELNLNFGQLMPLKSYKGLPSKPSSHLTTTLVTPATHITQPTTPCRTACFGAMAWGWILWPTTIALPASNGASTTWGKAGSTFT
ncbi:MAG: BamA/TamA family outer membrane protein [Lewinellaceae bacterium]|nr:BamA/TamA family outer membrane protein [Lewinellaceae bacterium]